MHPPSWAHGFCLSFQLDTHVLTDTDTDRVTTQERRRSDGEVGDRRRWALLPPALGGRLSHLPESWNASQTSGLVVALGYNVVMLD